MTDIDTNIKHLSIEPKLASYLYPSIVSNRVENLPIAASTKSIVPLIDQNSAQSSFDERYSFTPSSELLYSTSIFKKCNIRHSFSNVKTYELQTTRTFGWFGIKNVADDTPVIKTMKIKTYSGEDIKTFETADIKHSTDCSDYVGNPNYFTANSYGFSTDPVNSYTSTTTLVLSNNDGGMHFNNPNVKHMDVLRRKLSAEEQQQKWDGLLCTDRAVVRNQYSVPMRTMWYNQYDVNNGTYLVYNNPNDRAADQPYVANWATDVSANSIYVSNSELEDDLTNSCSTQRRGKIFVNREEDVKYVFTKGIASPNYSWNRGTKKFEKVTDGGNPNSTQLFNLHLGDATYPSNVTNCRQAFEDGVSPYLLFWYTNKLELSPTDVDGAAAGSKTVTVLIEDKHQTLNVQIDYLNVISPVYHPLLSDTYNNTFSNTTKFSLEIKKRSTEPGMISMSTWLPGKIVCNTTPTDKDILFNSTMSQSTVYLTQYSMDLLAPAVQKTTVLPFNSFRAPTVQTQKVSLAGLNNGFKTTTIDVDPISIGDCIPSNVLIYFTNRPGIIIDNIQLVVNNNNNVLNSSTIWSLFDGTKGKLKSYNEFDCYGCYSRKYSAGFTWDRSYRQAYASCGTIAYLSFGNDIPMNSQFLVPSMTNLQMTISYKITVRVPILTNKETDTVNIDMYIGHESKNYITISNSESTNKTSLFTEKDVYESIETINKKAQAKEYHINTSRLVEGGSLHHVLKAVNIIPKAFKFGKNAYNFAKSAIPDAQTIGMKGIQTIGDVQQGINNLSRNYNSYFRK